MHVFSACWHAIRRSELSCAVLCAGALLLAGCRGGLNYGPEGPRYAGRPTPILNEPLPAGDTLRIASFNIEFGKHIERAVALLIGDTILRHSDVLLLQEVDAAAARRISEVLGMSYVYYPAILSLRTKRDFGNAVLSRWPIVEDAKILLPHVSRLRGTRRIATAATIRIGDDSVRAYSAHLGTLADVGPEGRRNQLRAILEDAARYRHAVVGGDMNDGAVGRLVRAHGFAWPTERGPHTIRLWRWDHIFLKGFELPAEHATGTVLERGGASDHRPVWAVGVLPRQAPD